MNLSPDNAPPTAVAWLGYGGLLPFVLLISAVYFLPQHRVFLGQALCAYGAVILSFVGALHWGFAMTLQGLSTKQRLESYVWSVVPALLAWPALVVESAALGSGLLALGFVANYWRDVCLARATRLPGWYLPLRLRLTTVAGLCLLLLVAKSLT